MNKKMKLKSIRSFMGIPLIAIAVLFILLTITSCSSGSGIRGALDFDAQRTSLDVTADFEENALLSESTTRVSIRIYESDETFKSVKSASLVNNISASVTFDSLTANTIYILKLFVSVDGIEEELDKITARTLDAGLSEDSPIEISTVAEFKNMANDRDAYYKLTQDIDFAEAGELNLFTSSTNAFEGSFDGNGHTLKNIKLSPKTYSGIFEYTNGATISNLKLESVSLAVSSSVRQAGALIGLMKDSTIKDITLDGFTLTTSATTTTSDVSIGSLVGATDTRANIENCHVSNVDMDVERIRTSKTFSYGMLIGNLAGEANLKSSSTSGVMNVGLYSSGDYYIGGLIGVVSSTGRIESCYTDAVITVAVVSSSTTTSTDGSSNLFIGGLVGGNFGSNHLNLNDCLAIADISAMSVTQNEEESLDDWITRALDVKLANRFYIGGLVGAANRTSYGITNCVYTAKDFGIRVATVLKDTDDSAEVVYPEAIVSTTIARCLITTGKIDDVFALEDSISFNFTAQELTLETVEDEEEATETYTTVTDSSKNQEIYSSIVEAGNVSSGAASVLSESLKEVLENRA